MPQVSELRAIWAYDETSVKPRSSDLAPCAEHLDLRELQTQGRIQLLPRIDVQTVLRNRGRHSSKKEVDGQRADEYQIRIGTNYRLVPEEAQRIDLVFDP